MIPKKIHYCWFGKNPLSDLAKNCIESWKKFCPDYEIIEWNESNFDVNCCEYAKQAYEAKKWAFVSDVARLYALVNYGGIYMDTDVEVLKPLDDFLSNSAFSGFEAVDRIPTGIMAAEKGQPLFVELLEEYNNARFLLNNGEYDLTTNVIRITETCKKYGLRLDNSLQTVNGFTLYPFDYFCPKDGLTKKITLTENTHVIHHFDGSWLTDVDKLEIELTPKYMKFLGRKLGGLYARFVAIKRLKGFRSAVKETLKWLKK